MHAMEAGHTYLVETMTWTYVATVDEVLPLGVRFSAACKVPYLNDPEKFIRTGKFSSGDEAYPLPEGLYLPALWIGPSIPFAHPVPTKRTHSEA